MWVGLTVALAISSVGGVYLWLRTDWDAEVRKVQNRMGDGAEGGSATPTIRAANS